jgi:hypothetical protein
MSSDRSIARYRRWYVRLLRLYPRPHRERFGESMEQTFGDLLRERRGANRGLRGLMLGTFAETSAGIFRENMTHLFRHHWNVIRWVLVTAVLLLVPFLAMQFNWLVPDPGSSTREDVAWSLFDFAFAGTLLLGTGLMYELATKRAGHVAQRAAVGIAVVAGLLLVWINGAVGMIGSESNPANLMYLGVLAVGLIGAWIARLEPGGMSRALFATALAQTVVPVIALVAGFAPTLLADAFFVALWVASALLFRHASVASSPPRPSVPQEPATPLE